MTRKSNVSFTPKRKARFLKILADTGNVTAAADAVGISRMNAYLHREKDEEFRTGWDEAIERAIDELEHAVRDRAIKGVERFVVSMGKVVLVEELQPDGSKKMVPLMERQYSDSLAAILLKAHRPEKYRDRPSGDMNANLAIKAEKARISIIAQIDTIRERLYGRIPSLPAGGGDVVDLEPIPAGADGESSD